MHRREFIAASAAVVGDALADGSGASRSYVAAVSPSFTGAIDDTIGHSTAGNARG